MWLLRSRSGSVFSGSPAHESAQLCHVPVTVFLQCNLHEEDGGVKEEANSKELLKTVCAVHDVLL